MALRWIVFVVFWLVAALGVFLCLTLFGVSFVGFDSPQSDKLWWPYLLVAGSFILLVACGILLINGLSLMKSGRTRAAFASIGVPAMVPLVFLLLSKYT